MDGCQTGVIASEFVCATEDTVNGVACIDRKWGKCIEVPDFSWEATAPGLFPMQISLNQMSLKLDMKEVQYDSYATPTIYACLHAIVSLVHHDCREGQTVALWLPLSITFPFSPLRTGRDTYIYIYVYIYMLHAEGPLALLCLSLPAAAAHVVHAGSPH